MSGRDPEYLAFAQALDAAVRSAPPETIEQQRAGHLAHHLSLPRPFVAEVRELQTDGGQARLYHPAPGQLRPGFVFFHGGGFFLGGVEAYDPIVRVLVEATGWAFVSVDYRLAPEHPFPASVEDCLATTKSVLATADELGLSRVGVAGDSSGANLAAVVAHRLRAPMLAAQLLVYGVYDLVAEPELPVDPDGLALTGGDWDGLVDRYLGTVDRHHPDASPQRAGDFRGLPPAVVVTAEYDNLRPQGRAYADTLAAAGVPTVYIPGTGLDHAFLAWGSFASRPREAIAEIASALTQLTGEPR